MSTIKPELIRLLNIITKKNSIEISDEFLQRFTGQPENIRIQSFNKIGFNQKEKNAKIELGFLFEAVNEDDIELGAKSEFLFEFFFHIENLKDFSSKVENVPHISGVLAGTLMSIAYSTARGIIYERNIGTIFSNLILPVVDPNKFLQEGRQ